MPSGPRDGAATDNHDDVNGVCVGEEINLATVTVKMKLASFCPNKQLRSMIEKSTLICNVMVAEAYALAELHIVRALEAGRPIAFRGKEQWEKFYYQCLCAVSIRNTKDSTIPKDVADSASAFDELRPAGQRKVDASLLGEVLPDLRKVMATSAVNSLNSSACGRLKRFLRWKHPSLRTYFSTIVAMVLRCPNKKLDEVVNFRLATKKGKSLSNAIVAKRTQARQLTERLRGMCPAKSGVDKVTATTATAVLPLMHHILKETEAHLATRTKGTAARRFALLPRKHGCTVGNVPVCTRTMLRLVSSMKTREGRAVCHIPNPQSFNDPDSIWRQFFNVDMVETHTRKFAGQIVTDGCSVSISMNLHRAHVSSALDITDGWSLGQDSKGLPVSYVGVDPGVSDVVTLATYSVGGGEPSVSSYSASRYYEEAKIKTSNRRTDKWNKETAALCVSMNVASDRSTSDGVGVSISAFLLAFRPLLKHRAKRGYRNMRFMRYTQKQITVQHICDIIAPRDRLSVVGFGNWRGVGSTPIKRRFCGPIQDIKRNLRQRTVAITTAKGKVLPPTVAFGEIDEHKTSVTEHTSWTRMTNMVADQVKRQRDGGWALKNKSKVHKVLHARNSVRGISRTETTWNRDINAARNILMLMMMALHGFARPKEFCRA